MINTFICTGEHIHRSKTMCRRFCRCDVERSHPERCLMDGSCVKWVYEECFDWSEVPEVNDDKT